MDVDQRHTNPRVAAQLDSPFAALDESQLAADQKEQQNNLDSMLLLLFPDELIRAVLLCVHDACMYGSGGRLNWLRTVPICRRIWRVALHTPELWSTLELSSTIVVDLPFKIRHGFGPTRRERAMVDRVWSSTHPLSLYLNIRGEVEENQEFLSQVSELASRTRYLQIRSEQPYMDMDMDETRLNMYQVLKTSRWEILEHLEIYLNEAGVVAVATDDLLGGWPRSLQTLVMNGVIWNIQQPFVLPDLRYLEVDSTHSSVYALRTFLSQSSHLVSLEIVAACWETGERLENTPITLPHLRTMKLKGGIHSLVLLLRTLPNPQRSLSIVMIATWSAKEAMIAEIIGRVLTFVNDTRAIPVPVPYKLVFARQTDGIYPNVKLLPLPQTSDSVETRLVEYTGICQFSDLLSFARTASSVEFDRPIFHFAAVVPILSSPHVLLKEVYFPDWGLYWGRPKQAPLLAKVEHHLRRRQGNGIPLPELVVNARSPASEWGEKQAKKWLQEGLIADVKIRVAEGDDPLEGYSNSLNSENSEELGGDELVNHS